MTITPVPEGTRRPANNLIVGKPAFLRFGGSLLELSIEQFGLHGRI